MREEYTGRFYASEVEMIDPEHIGVPLHEVRKVRGPATDELPYKITLSVSLIRYTRMFEDHRGDYLHFICESLDNVVNEDGSPLEEAIVIDDFTIQGDGTPFTCPSVKKLAEEFMKINEAREILKPLIEMR